MGQARKNKKNKKMLRKLIFVMALASMMLEAEAAAGDNHLDQHREFRRALAESEHRRLYGSRTERPTSREQGPGPVTKRRKLSVVGEYCVSFVGLLGLAQYFEFPQEATVVFMLVMAIMLCFHTPCSFLRN